MIRRLALTRPIAEVDAVKTLGKPSMTALGARIRLVTWNMSKARRSSFLADVAQLAGGTDLILLQEAVLHGDRAHDFHDTSGFEWMMGQSFRHRSKAITTGVKTGSRAPSSWHALVRSEDREPVVRAHKSVLATRYQVGRGGASLLVLNVHAINFVGTRKYGRQVAQAVELIWTHPGPLILAGDFNTWSPQRRRILTQAVDRMGLTRVPVAARKLVHFNQVLDHVFYRGLELVAARPLLDIKGSDHVPLWAEFKVV